MVDTFLLLVVHYIYYLMVGYFTYTYNICMKQSSMGMPLAYKFTYKPI